MDEALQFDVVVVGCGSTGLALAHRLASDGHRVAAVDRWRLPVSFPKATHLDDETMRGFQTLGLADLEQTFSLCGSYMFYDSEWRPFMQYAWMPGKTEQGWEADYQFHQPDFESRLRGEVFAAPSAKTFFGWRMTALSQTDEGVTAELADVSTGETVSVTAAFLVASDGARSTVREMIGAEETNYNATHRSLIVDVHPYVACTKLPERDMFIRAGIRNPFTYVPIASPRLRFEEMLRPDDDVAAFESLDHVYEVLSEWLAPGEYSILRADVYEWRAVIVNQWRVGRVFLAGDACHEMPPFTGQGMCSGIRDALNLAWKFNRVLGGKSDVSLLETYESERLPHVEVFVKTAADMANQVEDLVAMPPQEGPPQVLSRDPARPTLGSGVTLDSDPASGTLSAQPILESGVRLDDAVGFEFAWVGDPDTIKAGAQLIGADAERIGVKLLPDSSDEVNTWLAGLDTNAVLVRPDRYIFATARSAEEMQEVTTRLDALI